MKTTIKKSLRWLRRFTFDVVLLSIIVGWIVMRLLLLEISSSIFFVFLFVFLRYAVKLLQLIKEIRYKKIFKLFFDM